MINKCGLEQAMHGTIFQWATRADLRPQPWCSAETEQFLPHRSTHGLMSMQDTFYDPWDVNLESLKLGNKWGCVHQLMHRQGLCFLFRKKNVSARIPLILQQCCHPQPKGIEHWNAFQELLTALVPYRLCLMSNIEFYQLVRRPVPHVETPVALLVGGLPSCCCGSQWQSCLAQGAEEDDRYNHTESLHNSSPCRPW
jgi:hypothetical protein